MSRGAVAEAACEWNHQLDPYSGFNSVDSVHFSRLYKQNEEVTGSSRESVLTMTDYSNSFTMSGCRLDNLELEEKKITAAHFGYMFYLKKHLCNDVGWHNLRAFLINRVEQLSNYALIVTFDDDNWNPKVKICNRKTYLKEKYNIDWNCFSEQELGN